MTIRVRQKRLILSCIGKDAKKQTLSHTVGNLWNTQTSVESTSKILSKFKMHIPFDYLILLQIYAAEKIPYMYKDAPTVMFPEILF